jgi:hypothetical protein
MANTCISGSATSFSFANFQGFTLTSSSTQVSGPLTWTDMLAGDSSTYVYSTGTINGSTYAVFSPSSITITDASGNLYEFISDQSGNNATAYTYTDPQTTIPTSLESGFTFTTYNMVATNNQISTSTASSPPGLGISNCCIPNSTLSATVTQSKNTDTDTPVTTDGFTEYIFSSTTETLSSNSYTYSLPTPSGSTINPTSCAYADGNTVFIGPGFVFGGNNLLFYSLNPWGDPTNTAVNSLPYSLGSSDNNTSTGTVFEPYANQFFGNVFSLPGSTASITGTNIMFVPYTDSSTGLQKLGAISFFLYSPYTTDTYIYNESGPTGNITSSSNPSAPSTFPYSAYGGYLYAYYDYQNTDISKNTDFSSVALPTGYTPFLFDSQNFPSSNGSCPSGEFCFQTWSACNNVLGNAPTDSTGGSSYFLTSTTMTNPSTNTTYQLFGAVPVNFASANTNYTDSGPGDSEGDSIVSVSVNVSGTSLSAQGQYIGNATYSSTSGVGGTPFCSGTLIAGSFLNGQSFSSFFGKSNLTTTQQELGNPS